MARRPRLFAPGLLYHVIVRGNQRQRTFLRHNDYQTYLERLGRYRRKYHTIIYAYCLMPNHVHLLLESSTTPLAKFMQGLNQSYTQYFNRVHHKVGHLFQGRYKAIICQREEYLLELIRYIHLNPVRAKMAQSPEQYDYSGHRVYLSGSATEVLDPTKVLRLVGGRAAYRSFVLDGLGGDHKEEYYKVEDQRFLGAEGFGEGIQEKMEETARVRRKRVLSKVVEQLAKHLGTEVDVLRSSDRSWRTSKTRTLLAYTLIRRLGYRTSEVAAYLGRDIVTLSTLVTRFSERVESDRRIKRAVDGLLGIV